MDSIKLKHPITVNGKKRSKLNYNAEEITGDMYAEACKKARENTNGTYETAEIDYTLQLYIGFESIIAVNSDIDLADLEIGVRGPDLVKIAGIGRTFFIDAWEDSEGGTSDELTDNTGDTITPVKPNSENQE